MSKKIIYAEDLMDAIRDDPTVKGSAYAAVRRHINGAKAVEAVEVVHGRWIRVFDDSAGWVDVCSECKEFGDNTPYCPCCGAKMDGGNEDA